VLMPSWTLAGSCSGESGTTGTASPKGTVGVIGAGQRALTTALRVAADAQSVVLIADGRLGADTSGLARRALIDRCDLAGVDRVAGTVTAIRASSLVLADGSEVACDSIVLAEPLHAVVPPKLGGVRIGDALVPGDIAAAIASGRQAAEALG
ncbi:MAG: hypothetical protein GY720_14910, partial [bacterium]|nr:hypothetical protein [bacterium]